MSDLPRHQVVRKAGYVALLMVLCLSQTSIAAASLPIVTTYWASEPLQASVIEQSGDAFSFTWMQLQSSEMGPRSFASQTRNRGRAACKGATGPSSVLYASIDLEHGFVAGPLIVECDKSQSKNLPSEEAILQNIKDWERLLKHPLVREARKPVLESLVLTSLYRKSLLALGSSAAVRASQGCPLLNVSALLSSMGFDNPDARDFTYPLCTYTDASGKHIALGLETDWWFWGNKNFNIDKVLGENLRAFSRESAADVAEVPRQILREWANQLSHPGGLGIPRRAFSPMRLTSGRGIFDLEFDRAGTTSAGTSGFRIVIKRELPQIAAGAKPIKSKLVIDNENSLRFVEYLIRRDLLQKVTTVNSAVFLGDIAESTLNDKEIYEFELVLANKQVIYAECDKTCRTVDTSDGSRNASRNISSIVVRDSKMKIRTSSEGEANDCIEAEVIPTEVTLIATEAPPWKKNFCEVRIDQDDAPLFSEGRFQLTFLKAYNKNKTLLKHDFADRSVRRTNHKTPKDEVIILHMVDCSSDLPEIEFNFEVVTPEGKPVKICESQAQSSP